MQITRIEYEESPSFKDAWLAQGGGYENRTLLGLAPQGAHFLQRPALTELPEYLATLLAAFAMIGQRTKTRPLRVMDFGGALGSHWTYVDEAFNGGLALDWLVVETPMYAAFGAQNVRDTALRFTASIDDAGPLDVAYFSGVLGYIENWRAPLDHPRVRQSEFIFLSRTTLGEREIPYVQKVSYGNEVVTYPGRILNAKEVTDALMESHDLLASWKLVHSHIGGRIFEAPGMLWRRRDIAASAATA